jgi:hypothetical protein
VQRTEQANREVPAIVGRHLRDARIVGESPANGGIKR